MMQDPSDLDKINYDAPLSFPEPSQKWKFDRGGLKSCRNDYIPDDQVPKADLTGKWVIISGSNNGIGREAALAFARMGANLILACRDPPPTENDPEAVVLECLAEAKKSNHVSTIEWWMFNGADLASVEAFAQKWLDTGRPLDILCNNAGMGSSPGGSDVFTTKDGFEIVHQVNLLCHILLTLRLLPSLAKAPMPRIICTTSCFHFLGRYDISNFNGGPGLSGNEGVNYYQNNKLYFQIWLTELQQRLLRHPPYRHITANGIHPGYVNTGVWNLNRANSWLVSAKTLFVKTAARFLAITPQQGCIAILHAALAPECGPDPAAQGVGGPEGRGGGRYFNRIWEQEPMPHCKDEDARLRVWRKVNEELALQEKGLLDGLGLYSVRRIPEEKPV